MTATGVLCARVRVEEKQIIAALGDAGVTAVPVPPASAPLPPDPASPLAALGHFIDATTGGSIDQVVTCMIDRAPNRAVAAATVPLLRALGVRMIDAGLAATGSRLAVAVALARAGLPRPPALAAFSEESGVRAAVEIGFPATLLGLTPGGAATTLHDRDTADAVIEHRVVLGDAHEAIALVQAGAPDRAARTRVHVVGGRAIAVENASGAEVDGRSLAIAEGAARALGASLVMIELADVGHRTVVWDVHPVAEFRGARQLGEMSIAGAVAALVGNPPHDDAVLRTSFASDGSRNGWEATVEHGAVLSA